jgi:hypothetical protein
MGEAESPSFVRVRSSHFAHSGTWRETVALAPALGGLTQTTVNHMQAN